MISFETKVNGVLISYIYCHNLGKIYNMPDTWAFSGVWEYEYKYYEIGKETVITGKITHKRSDGALVLQKKIIKDILERKEEKIIKDILKRKEDKHDMVSTKD